jgi:TET-Associated Glycosyltransferase
MQIYIPSYNRPDTITTSKLLHEAGLEHTVIVHDEEQKRLYQEAGNVKGNLVIGVSKAGGLAGQRWWIDTQSNIEDGEWYAQLDDNITEFTMLSHKHYWKESVDNRDHSFDKEFFTPLYPSSFFTLVESEMIPKANEWDAHLIGFAITKNPYMRGKKWHKIGFIVGKVMIIKKSHVTFMPDIFCNDDYQITLAHLLEFGAVLRNDFIYPDFPRYQVGGLGKLKDRFEPYANAVKILMERYPDALNLSHRADLPYGSSVRLRFTDASEKSLDRWRRTMGARGGEV